MKQNRKRKETAGMNFLRYLGPGLLVTVGFIDPGNWASNIAAGSGYGYELLWMVTLSMIMLIFLQHNAAHLGIVTGKCLSEAASLYLPEKHDSCDGDDGSGGDRNGGDPRRCDCAPDAVRHSDQARQYDDSRAGFDL